jgi:DNA invertase Pin-like site-specific DNA recombinase/ssDNA-binding Zn-finger/Zn-ribbon topoisomerase 1
MDNLSLFNSFSGKNVSPIRNGSNAVIYTRVSHFSQEENTSLESQKKYCENFAERRGLQIIDYFGGIYESAKTDDRKEFSRMLMFIRRNKQVNYIIVYSYERFSRSGIDGAKIASDLLRDLNVKTLAVTQELDPTTSSGLFQQNIFFLFSQMDNDLRRDKTVTGMRELLRKGYWPLNLPKGYTNLYPGKAINQELVINKEGEFIRKAFLWKANEKMRNADIVRRYKSLGYKMGETRLGLIFRNTFYCGIITNSLIPGEVIVGRHEPLVSRELFLKVNDILTGDRVQPLKHKKYTNELPLKIFTKCKTCGNSMSGYQVKKKGIFYYCCCRSGCKSNKSAKNLHQQFLDKLTGLKLENDFLPLLEEGIRILFHSIYKDQLDEEQMLLTRKNEIIRKVEAIEERFAIGEITAELFEKYQAKYQYEIQYLLDFESRDGSFKRKIKDCIEFARQVSQNPKLLWENGSIDQRTRLQLLLFPEGAIYDPQSGLIQVVRITDFFDGNESKKNQFKKTDHEKLPPIMNFTTSEVLCGSLALKQKWTHSYISLHLANKECSPEYHKHLVEFMEDFCLLMVGAYLK